MTFAVVSDVQNSIFNDLITMWRTSKDCDIDIHCANGTKVPAHLVMLRRAGFNFDYRMPAIPKDSSTSRTYLRYYTPQIPCLKCVERTNCRTCSRCSCTYGICAAPKSVYEIYAMDCMKMFEVAYHSEIVARVVQYCYTGRLELQPEEWIPSLCVLQRFNEKEISKNLNDYTIEHIAEVPEEDISLLPEDTLKALISAGVDEVEVWRTRLLRWMRKEPARRAIDYQKFCELLEDTPPRVQPAEEEDPKEGPS